MKVLCATDFSSCSSQAVMVASRIARLLGDELVLAHALEFPPRGLLAGGVPLPEGFYESLKTAAEQELEKAAAALRSEGLPVETEVIDGYAPHAILAAAHHMDARMIVLGSHERSLGGRVVSGSVSDEVTAGADRPVLVARGESPSLAADVAPSRLRVLLALDVSHASDAAVALLRSLRAHGPVDVVVAHCYWAPGEYRRLGLAGARAMSEADPEVIAVIERELRTKLGELAGEGRLSYRIAPSLGRPADLLARWAADEQVDLVLLGTHGRHGVARLWHGSVARDLLHVSPVPVLCAPSRTVPADEATPPRLHRMLAATDLSPLGDAAVRQAYAMVEPGGQVDIVYVHQRRAASPSYAYDSPEPPMPEPERAALEARLRARIPPHAASLGVLTRAAVVEAQKPAEGILAAAERSGSDALVIGSHGVTGLPGALLGSVAEGVVRGAHVPVMLVRKPPA